ncbi:MAG: hypothetical protein ABEJ28_11600 [Salinigranum sp.]
MADEFTEKEVGKRVVDQDGLEVGTVSGVRDGSMYVELSPDAPEDTLSELRWDGVVHQREHHLENQYVSNVSHDVVRLNV